MNRLFVQRGSPAKLVIDVWEEDTQRRVTERELIDLFESEERLDGGRFAKHLPEALKHPVKLRYVNYGQMRHSLSKLIEWIFENTEDCWNLSFEDDVNYMMGNPYPTLRPIFSFEHLADAVLFKLRFY